MSVKVKVALIGAAVLLIAAIISSCRTATSSLQAEMLAAVPPSSGTALPIFVGGKLAPGYDMGVNTSGGLLIRTDISEEAAQWSSSQISDNPLDNHKVVNKHHQTEDGKV